MKATKAKRKKTTPCNCIEEAQKALDKSHPGVQIVRHMQINFATGRGGMSGPSIHVERTSGRGKPPIFLCAYCPICGKKMNND